MRNRNRNSNSNPTFLYRPEDSRDLCSAIPTMMHVAEALRANFVQPTLSDRMVISSIIFDFVASRKRKVYGGNAINAAIVHSLGQQNSIYPPGSAQDIEFYSPQPIHDVQAICDILFARGFQFVRGKEAAHHGTYTISVMFSRICDVSLAPLNVFHALPILSLPRPFQHQEQEQEQEQEQKLNSNILYVHPRHILIDMLHILSDPFTSHWKLDRVIPRLVTLQSCYPILPVDVPHSDHKPVNGSQLAHDIDISAIIQDVSAWASNPMMATSVALVGSFADAFYRTNLDIPYEPRTSLFEMTFCSTNYAQDLESLAACLAAHGFRNPTEHFPVVSWLDRRATFVAFSSSHRIEITLCDSRKKVIPVSAKTPDGIWVASSTYAIAHALSTRFAHVCIGNSYLSRHFGSVAHSIATARAFALCELRDTVTSTTSVFRDVNLGYLGKPLSDMHIHMEAADDKRHHATPLRNKAAIGIGGIWFNYDPSRPNASGKKHFHDCANRILPCDGSVVKSPIYSTLEQTRLQRRLF